jgi:hypothetical protein
MHFSTLGIAALRRLILQTVFSLVAIGLIGVSIARPAQAQVMRAFPEKSKAGTFVVGIAPDVMIDGKAFRLAPGAMIRNEQNMIVMSASLGNASFPVRYTIDPLNNIQFVWFLNPSEIARERQKPR